MVEPRIGVHCICFGAYLAAMTLGSAGVHAWYYAALYAALFMALVWLNYRRIALARRRDAILAYGFFPVAINIAYPAMAGAVPLIRPYRYDGLLFWLDARLFGGNASVRMQSLVSPGLTELFSLSYILFMPLLFFSFVRYFFWQRDRLPYFFSGLFTVYGIGFLGYLLLPALGPYLALPALFTVPLEGGLVTHLNRLMVVSGSNRVDVFPSLHCAVSAYILGFAFRHQRTEFWWLVLPVNMLWVSTIYLRYHYLIDVACGFLLAIAGLAVAVSACAQDGDTADAHSSSIPGR